jgi:hypothetical protein
MNMNTFIAHGILLFVAMPTLLGIGLWLLAAPVDWQSCKTYAGLVAVVFAFKLI